MTTPTSTPPRSPLSEFLDSLSDLDIPEGPGSPSIPASPGTPDIQVPVVLSPEEMKSRYGLVPPDMDYMCSLCFLCTSPPSTDDLVFCATCQTQQYCSEECLELGWRWHQHQCPGRDEGLVRHGQIWEILAEEWTFRDGTDERQAWADYDWLAKQPLAYEERGRCIWHRFGELARTWKQKEDSIYYLRFTKPQSGLTMITGPYVRQQVVIDRVHEELAVELCREGRRLFQRVIDTFGFWLFTELTFDLPNGDSIKVDRIEETNVPVAKFLWSRERRQQTAYVYRVDSVYVPSPLAKQNDPDRQPAPVVVNPLGSFRTKEGANRQAVELFKTWEEETLYRSWHEGIDKDGLYMGSVEGWAKDWKTVEVMKVRHEHNRLGRLKRSQSVPARRRTRRE